VSQKHVSFQTPGVFRFKVEKMRRVSLKDVSGPIVVGINATFLSCRSSWPDQSTCISRPPSLPVVQTGERRAEENLELRRERAVSSDEAASYTERFKSGPPPHQNADCIEKDVNCWQSCCYSKAGTASATSLSNLKLFEMRRWMVVSKWHSTFHAKASTTT